MYYHLAKGSSHTIPFLLHSTFLDPSSALPKSVNNAWKEQAMQEPDFASFYIPLSVIDTHYPRQFYIRSVLLNSHTLSVPASFLRTHRYELQRRRTYRRCYDRERS